MALMCTECMVDFFYNPVKISMVVISLLLAIIFLLLARRKDIAIKKKLWFMYSHIFFVVFPFVFYLFFRGCETYFATCNKLKPILIMIGLTSFIAIIIGLILAPILFIQNYKRRAIAINIEWIREFIDTNSMSLNIKPRLFFVDIAKPLAFSISFLKPKIFISIGLMDLLTKKELEAVLLHEFAHIKNKTSLFKISSFLTNIISPLARFTTCFDELNKEEKKADMFAIESQKTSRYINSAKKKFEIFENGE